jgi:hypothetical protein
MKRVFLLCLAALMVGLPLVAHTARAKADVPQVRKSGYITTRDGTQLKYTVVMPATGGPFPTLFTYDGYDAGSNPDPDYIAQYVPEGYAFIGVSLRGTGCSGGVWDFFQPAEARDGVDVIRWIAAQKDWSNGKVAMIGKSYPGITQLFVAEEAAVEGASGPTGPLVAIAPGHTYGDIYRDVAFPGGIFNYSFASLWSFIAQPEPSYAAAFSGVAGGDQTCAQNQANRPQNIPKNAFVQAVQHQWDDALIKERSPIYNIGNINVPMYTVISWQDEQVGPRAVNWLSDVKAPLYATVTNGDHGMYRTTPSLTDLNKYFDHFLKGIDNGYENTPRIRVWWEAGRNGTRAPGWVTDIGAWPPPQTKNNVERWYLDQGGALSATPGSGLPDPYAYAGPTGQGIQNPAYSGVTKQPNVYLWSVKPAPGTNAAYTSLPLTKDTAVLGSGSLDLWLASTAVDTDLQVTISEVRPDGQEEYVQAGWLRASHRKLDPAQSTETRPYQTHQESDAAPLIPGTATPMRVEIFPFGHLFRKDSRIRISIEGPKFLPELWGFAALPLPATNLVYHDPAHPSSLALPVLPSLAVPDADKPLPPCGSLIRQPCRPA